MMENGSDSNLQSSQIEHPNYAIPIQESTKSWFSSFFESLKNIFCIRLHKEKQLSPRKDWNIREINIEQKRPLSIQLANKILIPERNNRLDEIICPKPINDQKMKDNTEKNALKRKEPECPENLIEIPSIVEPIAKVKKAEDSSSIPINKKKVTKKQIMIKEEENLAICIKKQMEKMKDSLAQTINAGLSELNNSQKTQIIEKEKIKASIHEKLLVPRKKTKDQEIQTNLPRIPEKIAGKSNSNLKANEKHKEDVGIKNPKLESIIIPAKEDKKETIKIRQESNSMFQVSQSLFSGPTIFSNPDKVKEIEKPKEKEEEKEKEKPQATHLFSGLLNNPISFGNPQAPKEAATFAEPPKKIEPFNLFGNNKTQEMFNIAPKKMISEEDTKPLFDSPKMDGIFSKPKDGEPIKSKPEVHENMAPSGSLFSPPFPKTETIKENMSTEAKPQLGLFKKPSETMETHHFQPSIAPVIASSSVPTNIFNPPSILSTPINVAPPANKLFSDVQTAINQTGQQNSPPKPIVPLFGNSSLPSTMLGSGGLFGQQTGNPHPLFGQSLQTPAVSTIGLSLNNPPPALFQSTPLVNNVSSTLPHQLFPSQPQGQPTSFLGQPTNPEPSKQSNNPIMPFGQNNMFSAQPNNAIGLFGTAPSLFGANQPFSTNNTGLFGQTIPNQTFTPPPQSNSPDGVSTDGGLKFNIGKSSGKGKKKR